jgi:hypothetical protein
MRYSVLIAAIATLGVVNGLPQLPVAPCVQQPAGIASTPDGPPPR